MFAYASAILFYTFYLQSTYKEKVISVVFKFIPIILLLPIIVALRFGCEFYGISFFSNPIVSLFIEDNQPIIQLIKSFFI